MARDVAVSLKSADDVGYVYNMFQEVFDTILRMTQSADFVIVLDA